MASLLYALEYTLAICLGTAGEGAAAWSGSALCGTASRQRPMSRAETFATSLPCNKTLFARKVTSLQSPRWLGGRLAGSGGTHPGYQALGIDARRKGEPRSEQKRPGGRESGDTTRSHARFRQTSRAMKFGSPPGGYGAEGGLVLRPVLQLQRRA